MSLRKTKLSRAQSRSRLRKGKRQSSSRGWTFATVAVVVIGLVGIAVARGGGSGGGASPGLGDHWHTALGVNVCGTWLGPTPSFDSINGIHAEGGDGLIHTHPTSSEATGDRATVGRFVDDNTAGDFQLSATSMTLWDGVEHRNGQECVDGEYAGQAAEVQWAVGRVGEPWDGTPRTGNPANYNQREGDVIAIAFIPSGEPIPEPPGAEAALGNPAGGSGAPAGGGGGGHGAP